MQCPEAVNPTVIALTGAMFLNLKFIHPLIRSRWIDDNGYNKQASAKRLALFERFDAFHSLLVPAALLFGGIRVVGEGIEHAQALAETGYIVVANHALVMVQAALGGLDDGARPTRYVFDEGHHLPAVALDQFSSSMDLSNLRWLDKLPKTMQEVATRMHLHLGDDGQWRVLLTLLA